MNVPIDATTFITTVSSSAFLGLAVACGKLWIGHQALTAKVSAVQAELVALKLTTATQAAELRSVSDALASISTDLRWIKERLASMPH